jgi:SAM-dependent methyltransferase
MRAQALVFSCFLACGTAHKPLDSAVQSSAPPMDDATLKAKSHRFFDAFDRLDVRSIADAIGPGFVWFEYGRFVDRETILKIVQTRIDRHAAAHSRTWSNERTYIGESSAVFIGDAVEHVPAEGGAEAFDKEGWNTLVWVRDGGAWKLAHWQWQKGGIDAEREVWNERFRHPTGFKLEPNQLLVDSVKGRRPGTALDLLMGQGRNAVYLAKQGWQVTGVDISDEGIRIAKEAAVKNKLKLEAIQADIDHWDLGTDKWDLVTMIYAGHDAKLVERAKRSLKKGGLFVLEGFHSVKEGGSGWRTGALAELFKGGFKILRNDVVDDIADFGLRKEKLVRFVAEKQ